MKPARGRSALFSTRRWLGVGTGVLVVTLAAGARGPVTGSLDAFMKNPADIPMPDVVLPEVAAGARLPVERPTNQTEAGLADQSVGSLGIPAPALRAYRNAETIMQDTSPSCGLTWEVLAGIGRVESDHGRYGGGVVGEDGVSSPQIYGVALNGVGDVAAISDSDGGSMDGDQVWDRAVGPLQFLPTTWDLVGVDGDQDGVANPHDLDDAALAAAVYLCAGDVDLTDREQLRTALYRYNPSEEYVDLVLSYIDAYREGDPVPIEVSTTPTDDDSDSDEPSQTVPFSQPDDDGPPSFNTPDGNDGDNDGPSDGPGGDNDGNGGDPDGDGGDPDGDGGDPDGDGGDNDGGDNNPPPSGEPPQQPNPDPQPDPDPDPDPAPELVTKSGILTLAGDGVTWQLDDGTTTMPLDFGPEEHVDNDAPAADYDGDGDAADTTVRDELMGLVALGENGTKVSFEVEMDHGTAVVYSIGRWDYRPADGSPPEWEQQD